MYCKCTLIASMSVFPNGCMKIMAMSVYNYNCLIIQIIMRLIDGLLPIIKNKIKKKKKVLTLTEADYAGVINSISIIQLYPC